MDYTNANIGLRPAAARLGISQHTLRRWALQHRVSHLRLGRRLLFRPSDLSEFEERNLIAARVATK